MITLQQISATYALMEKEHLCPSMVTSSYDRGVKKMWTDESGLMFCNYEGSMPNCSLCRETAYTRFIKEYVRCFNCKHTKNEPITNILLCMHPEQVGAETNGYNTCEHWEDGEEFD